MKKPSSSNIFTKKKIWIIEQEPTISFYVHVYLQKEVVFIFQMDPEKNIIHKTKVQ